jgi:hypothetical protein
VYKYGSARAQIKMDVFRIGICGKMFGEMAEIRG